MSKFLDAKSAVIGFLSAALIAVCIGAAEQPAQTGPRYQITGLGGELAVFDRDTNTVTLLTRQENPGRNSERNWVIEDSFTLGQAFASTHSSGFHRTLGKDRNGF